MISDRIRGHLNRRGLSEAYLTDPATHATATITADLLRVTEMALEDEHLPEEVIDRVLRTIVYAALPNPSDVQRFREMQVLDVKNGS